MKKQFIYKNQKKRPSRYGGTMYYLFFNDGERSFRTCIGDNFRNYSRWKGFIENAQKGDIVLGLVEKTKGLIDADSFPRFGGNIYEMESK
tara:strand:+ start:180 stop:449 length:270 start_codon:yes stop_codon:yes gene_type:complete